MKSEIKTAVRELLANATKGVLSTVAPDGHPYASLHAIAIDAEGSPLFLFSDLSQHTRNARAEPRVALLVEGGAPEPENNQAVNPQEIPRACISGELHEVPEVDAAALLEHYLEQHPAARLYAGFGDFNLFRMSMSKARYVGGFGQAGSVDLR